MKPVVVEMIQDAIHSTIPATRAGSIDDPVIAGGPTQNEYKCELCSY